MGGSTCSHLMSHRSQVAAGGCRVIVEIMKGIGRNLLSGQVIHAYFVYMRALS